MFGSEPPKVSYKLGLGSYGQIFALEKYPQMVTKRMNWEQDLQGIPYFVLREMASLVKLKQCPQVAQMESYFLTGTIPKNPKDKSPSTGMINILSKRYKHDLRVANQMSLYNVKQCLFQVLLALRFAEKKGIVHRDVKLDNIFCENSDKVVLGDWGLSRKMEANQDGIISGDIQTLWYRAPELLLGTTDYGTSIDVWSVGCVMFALIENKNLFESFNNHIGQLFKVFSMLGTPLPGSYLSQLPHFRSSVFPNYPLKQIQLSRDTSQTAVNLLNLMLSLDPTDRPSFENCLNHSYFDEVRNNFKETSTLTTTPEILKSPTLLSRITRNPMEKTSRMKTFDWMFCTLNSIYQGIALNSGRVCYNAKDLDFASKSTNCKFLDIFFLACDYYDSIMVTSKFDSNLMGAACLLTASKMLTSHISLNIYELAYYLNSHHTARDITTYELVMVHTLKFDLHKETLFNLVRKLQIEKNLPMCTLSAAMVYLADDVQKNTSQMIVDYCSGTINADFQTDILLGLFDSVLINRAMYIMGVVKIVPDLVFGSLERLTWHFLFHRQ
jgi:serine/threonine protein kinase